MMQQKTSRELILDTIESKSRLKQDVFAVTKDTFSNLNNQLSAISSDLKGHFSARDKRIEVSHTSPGPYEAQLKVAGDTLLFHMHTNVFTFPDNHMVSRSPYVMNNPANGYWGIINIYNFLTDSFRFHRENDSGYLVARVFVNRERHFFVEGKRQLGFLYNDFSQLVLSPKTWMDIIESAILYILDFDLYTPPYDAVKEVQMAEILTISQNLKIKTGKRLGFRFEADTDQVKAY